MLTRIAFLLLGGFGASSQVTAPTAGQPTTVAAGTELILRLTSPVSSSKSKVNDPISAVLISPVFTESAIAIPAGTGFSGKVQEAKASGASGEKASLLIALTTVRGPDQPIPITGRLLEVDNARETVDSAGRIQGIVAAETLAGRADQGIARISKSNPELAGILAAAKGTVIRNPPSGEIEYGAGIELRFALTSPLRWPASAPDSNASPGIRPPGAFPDPVQLAELVNGEPFRTQSLKPAKPSDITNLMFIGTDIAIRKAFTEAGWVEADALNSTSVMETAAAIAELRGYKQAPMSVLTLDGARSDFDWQKGNNTFAKRHHLRIWKRPALFNGLPVWVSSSTHDIGISFSEENRSFIHLIDSEIDRERAKVVTDLVFTGRVEARSLADRPAVPKLSTNATGDELRTDGRMAVLLLKGE